jgi:Tetracyclin repressor-like, C-terminal domain
MPGRSTTNSRNGHVHASFPVSGPALALRSVSTWSRLHGLASLEIEGNFASMGLDAELIFTAEVNALLAAPPRVAEPDTCGRGSPAQRVAVKRGVLRRA